MPSVAWSVKRLHECGLQARGTITAVDSRATSAGECQRQRQLASIRPLREHGRLSHAIPVAARSRRAPQSGLARVMEKLATSKWRRPPFTTRPACFTVPENSTPTPAAGCRKPIRGGFSRSVYGRQPVRQPVGARTCRTTVGRSPPQSQHSTCHSPATVKSRNRGPRELGTY